MVTMGTSGGCRMRENIEAAGPIESGAKLVFPAALLGAFNLVRIFVICGARPCRVGPFRKDLLISPSD
jgi:hypothetical protein